MDNSMPTRRRLSVSLRALMLAVLAAGVWMGWQANRARRQRGAVAAIEEHGGRVLYDWEFVDGERTPGTQPHAPRWLRGLLGDEFFQSVVQVYLILDDPPGEPLARLDAGFTAHLEHLTGLRKLLLDNLVVTDKDLGRLKRLTNLEELSLWDATEVTAEGLAHLEHIHRLKYLIVVNSRVTDDGLRALAGLPRLEFLCLAGNPISDAGLVHLKGLKNLRSLNLISCRLTDDGLEELKGMSNLESLWVSGTAVTESGKKAFKAAMPNLKAIQ